MSAHSYDPTIIGWLAASSPSWHRIRPNTRVLGGFDAVPLQLGSNPHLLATVGIVALTLLGCGMVLRKRLTTERRRATDHESPHREVKTDREKICELVSENGGRMKQSEIVNAVDWSKAKVSRLLTDLESDERVTKLRLGRENLICLPGHEPTASKSTTNTGDRPDERAYHNR